MFIKFDDIESAKHAITHLIDVKLNPLDSHQPEIEFARRSLNL